MTPAYSKFATSAPVGVIELRCLEISHPSLAAPLRLVADYQDWMVTLETGAVATFAAVAFRTGRPAIDDKGVIERQLQIDVVDGSMLAALLPLAQSSTPITCTLRTYLSSDLTAPQFVPVEQLTLRNVQVNKSVLTATARGLDVVNKKFPTLSYTTDNTPGLRR